MDGMQPNHLGAYGGAFYALKSGVEVDWLLNSGGGAFAFKANEALERMLSERGVGYRLMTDDEYEGLLFLQEMDSSTAVRRLTKAPRLAVYSPQTTISRQDPARRILDFAKIPYDVLTAEDVMSGKLKNYDWLSLENDDFTGSHNRLQSSYGRTEWYQTDVKNTEQTAQKLGFSSVSAMKSALAQRIKGFCQSGGILFAMNGATETLEIALSAENLDIYGEKVKDETPFYGPPTTAKPTPSPPPSRSPLRLNFEKTLAFEGFKVFTDPNAYPYSEIDNTRGTERQKVAEKDDYFQLSRPSAQKEPMAAALCQNHSYRIKCFYGKTTGFKLQYIKPDVKILAAAPDLSEARYLHGTLGDGWWTFYSGRDPEDYQHYVGEELSDLNYYKTSPGYRLILNNVFAAMLKP